MKRRDFLKGTAQTAVGAAAIATVGIPEAMAVPKQVWTAQHVKVGLDYSHVADAQRYTFAIARELQKMKERAFINAFNAPLRTIAHD